MPFIVANDVSAYSQGQRTHSARTNNLLTPLGDKKKKGEPENKAKSAQLKLEMGWAWQLALSKPVSLAIEKIPAYLKNAENKHGILYNSSVSQKNSNLLASSKILQFLAYLVW